MSVRCTCAADPELAPRDHSPSCVSRLQAEVDPDAFGAAGYLLRPPGPAVMSPEQAEVLQAFATLRRHLPASLRMAEAELEAAWFNGGPLLGEPTEGARLRALIAKYREKSAEYLGDWQDWDSHDGHQRCGQGIAYSDVADELEALLGEES